MPQLAGVGRLMGAPQGGAVTFPYVYNAKLSNTTQLRAAITAAKTGSGTRGRIFPLGDSRFHGNGSLPIGGDSTKAIYTGAPFTQLATALTAAGIPAKANSFLGSGGVTAAQYALY